MLGSRLESAILRTLSQWYVRSAESGYASTKKSPSRSALLDVCAGEGVVGEETTVMNESEMARSGTLVEGVRTLERGRDWAAAKRSAGGWRRGIEGRGW